MKLDRVAMIAGAGALLSILCGCSSSSVVPAPRSASIGQVPVAYVGAPTQLTSADAFASRTPKVGKSQLVSDDEIGGGSADDSEALGAPKLDEPRRADSRRRGGFGSTK